jgi:hypothetical protein
VVCHFRRGFELVDRLLRELLLTGPLGVVHGLLPGLVTGDRHDLMNRTAGLSKGDGGILPQAVRGVFLGAVSQSRGSPAGPSTRKGYHGKAIALISSTAFGGTTDMAEPAVSSGQS